MVDRTNPGRLTHEQLLAARNHYTPKRLTITTLVDKLCDDAGKPNASKNFRERMVRAIDRMNFENPDSDIIANCQELFHKLISEQEEIKKMQEKMCKLFDIANQNFEKQKVQIEREREEREEREEKDRRNREEREEREEKDRRNREEREEKDRRNRKEKDRRNREEIERKREERSRKMNKEYEKQIEMGKKKNKKRIEKREIEARKKTAATIAFNSKQSECYGGNNQETSNSSGFIFGSVCGCVLASAIGNL